MVLIVGKSIREARLISEIFHYMGILSFATVPERAVGEINNRFRAILVCNPETLNEPEEFIRVLKKFSLSAPVFAISQDKNEYVRSHPRDMMLFDMIFADNTYSSGLYNAITDFQRQNKLPILGEYKLAGFDASAYLDKPVYFDKPLSFTKTEIMILRYLLRSYPVHVTARDILKFAFKPSKTPEPSNIRTHISVINKKFKTIAGRPCIFSEPRLGYKMLTAEIMCASKNK